MDSVSHYSTAGRHVTQHIHLEQENSTKRAVEPRSACAVTPQEGQATRWGGVPGTGTERAESREQRERRGRGFVAYTPWDLTVI